MSGPARGQRPQIQLRLRVRARVHDVAAVLGPVAANLHFRRSQQQRLLRRAPDDRAGHEVGGAADASRREDDVGAAGSPDGEHASRRSESACRARARRARSPCSCRSRRRPRSARREKSWGCAAGSAIGSCRQFRPSRENHVSRAVVVSPPNVRMPLTDAEVAPTRISAMVAVRVEAIGCGAPSSRRRAAVEAVRHDVAVAHVEQISRFGKRRGGARRIEQANRSGESSDRETCRSPPAPCRPRNRETVARRVGRRAPGVRRPVPLRRLVTASLLAAGFGHGVEARLTIGEQNDARRGPASARRTIADVGERLGWLIVETDAFQSAVRKEADAPGCLGPRTDETRPRFPASSLACWAIERSHPELRPPGVALSCDEREMTAIR